MDNSTLNFTNNISENISLFDLANKKSSFIDMSTVKGHKNPLILSLSTSHVLIKMYYISVVEQAVNSFEIQKKWILLLSMNIQ